MRILVWLLRALVLFALFAFALNNRAEVVVQWFFGYHWQAPLVIVVFAAFAAGCAVGVLAMTPAWWRRRAVAQRQAASDKPLTSNSSVTAASNGGGAGPNSMVAPAFEHPPREGL
jgi:lipopolysaccharide assembly protein A